MAKDGFSGGDKHTGRKDAKATLHPGTRVLWSSTYGNVIRTGRIIEETPTRRGRSLWFVEIDPDPTLPKPDGFRTWIPGDCLVAM